MRFLPTSNLSSLPLRNPMVISGSCVVFRGSLVTWILICEGLETDVVWGVCRRERASRQGLESGEKGEKEVRKEEIVESGIDILEVVKGQN